MLHFTVIERPAPLVGGAPEAVMRTRRRFTAKRPDPKALVSWLFTKGARVITCCVEATEDARVCSVSLLPHWDATRAIVERFAGPAKALARHASLAAHLRNAGWRLAAYTK